MARKITPRKNPTQHRSRATVDALVTAAVQVLELEGEKGLTTNRIAERAGVSIGTLYQYFPNKEALLIDVVRAQQAQMRETIRAQLERHADAPIRELTRQVLQGLIELKTANWPLAVNLERFAMNLGEQSGMDVLLEEVQGFVSRVCERRKDELGGGDPELNAFVIVRALDGILRGTFRHRPELFEDPAFLDRIVELVARYLEKDAAVAEPPRRAVGT